MLDNNEEYIAEHWYLFAKSSSHEAKKLCWKSSQVADFCCSSKVWQETQGLMSADVDVKCNTMPSQKVKSFSTASFRLETWDGKKVKSVFSQRTDVLEISA